MEELVRALNLYGLCGPSTQDHELVRASCKCEFEPPGAYERWSLEWHLELLTVEHHTQDTRTPTGWRCLSDGKHMSFVGRTLEDATAKALQFVNAVKPHVLEQK